MDIYVSTLTPITGADIYGGVRTAVFLNEEDAYRDMLEWLDKPEFTSITEAADTLDDSIPNVITQWYVHKHEVPV